MNYKGIEYEIQLYKLKYDLGYCGCGIVYMPIRKGFDAKHIFSFEFDHFKTKDTAEKHLSHLVKDYIDENA